MSITKFTLIYDIARNKPFTFFEVLINIILIIIKATRVIIGYRIIEFCLVLN